MADAKADDVQEPKDEVLEALKDDEQESPAEPSTAKETKPDAEAKEEAKAEPEAEETEEETQVESEETEKPQGKAEERKAQLNTEIRDLVSRRNAIKAEVEKKNAEVYQPATDKDLEGQPKDPDNPESAVYTALEAKVEAMRQDQEMRQFNERVAETQLKLSSDSERVLNDFPLFNPDSPQYNKELAEEAAQTLDSNLIRDENTGQIIGNNPGFDTYKFYNTLARAHGISTTQGQIAGQQAAEQMMANADSPGSTAPQKKAEDPIQKILASDDD